MQFFIHVDNQTIKTNILKCLIERQPLEEIKQLIEKLEKTEFDVTQEVITFEGVEYGIFQTKK